MQRKEIIKPWRTLVPFCMRLSSSTISDFPPLGLSNKVVKNKKGLPDGKTLLYEDDQ